MNRFDPGGDDSYFVARRLDSFVGRFGYGHSYVVSNATRVGDPNATIHSFGKLSNGNMGSVNDPNRAADVSKTTFQSDSNNWRSLAPDATKDVVKLNAPDKTVDAVAGAVKENTPYALNPSSSSATPDTNSNSAAFAVGDKAQQLSTGKSDSVVNEKTIDLTLPGASAAGKVAFQCTTAMHSIGGCK